MLDRGPQHANGEWLARWRGINACTDPADRETAQSAVIELYRAVGAAAPKFFWFDSPLAMFFGTRPWPAPLPPEVWPTAKVLRRVAPASYEGPPPARLQEEVGNMMLFRLMKAMSLVVLRKLLGFSEADSPFVPPPSLTHVADPVRRAFGDWLYIRSGGDEPGVLMGAWILGQQDAAWLAPYQYWREVAGYRYPALQEQMLDAWTALAESCGWVAPSEYCCLLSERPERLALSDQGLLHSEQLPAVRFRDGCSVWALNGVAVPRWLVETAPGQLDPRRILEIENTSIRREFVRKVGMDRICARLDAVRADRQGDYELLQLDLGENRQRPYLKMLNPSTGAWHIEGVHPDCRTVAEALEFRNGTTLTPTILT